MSLRRKTSWLLRGMKNFIVLLLRLVLFAVKYTTKNLRNINRNINKYLAGKKLVIFVLFLFIAFIAISLAALLPGTHVFEGNVIVEEMSFTYTQQQPKLFLQSIRNISKLQINKLNSEGIQTLTLTGKFTSTSLPQLNELNTLKIELTDSNSKLIITPFNSKVTSEIDLNELRIQPNTKVRGLSYDSYRRRLAFSLEPTTAKLGNQGNSAKIYLGEKPLNISLEGYKLPDIKLAKNRDKQAPLEFKFNPDIKQLNLKISQPNTIYLTRNKPREDNDEKWFSGRIASKYVKFQRLERSGDIRDDLAISTIIEGKVRMADKEQEIKQNQFLMSGKPDVPLNIELIRHLQITKKGLEVRFAGKTQQIKIGLDQDFPVSTIQGSRLDGILPRDATIAIFSFAAGTITSLLSYVIENASNSNSKQP